MASQRHYHLLVLMHKIKITEKFSMTSFFYVLLVLFLFVDVAVYFINQKYSAKYIDIWECLSRTGFHSKILNNISNTAEREYISSLYKVNSEDEVCLDTQTTPKQIEKLNYILQDNDILYAVDKKYYGILSIPRCFTKQNYSRYVVGKLTNTEDMVFINNLYRKTGSGFCNDMTMNNDTSSKVKELLVKSGYYTDLVDRQRENTVKTIINGYLGQFFYFKYVSTLCWLILPLGIYILTKKRYRFYCLYAFAFSYFLCSLVISLKFSHNPRYLSTFIPLTLFIIFYCYFDILNVFKFKRRLWNVLGLLVIFVQISWLTASYGQFLEGNVKASPSALLNRLTTTMSGYYGSFRENRISIKMILQYFAHVFPEHGPKLADIYPFPSSYLGGNGGKNIEGMLRYITNNLTETDVVLVNNYPSYFYYLTRRGVYYWSGSDVYYAADGPHGLFNNNVEQAREIILNELKCHYVLSSNYYNRYNQKFEFFLKNYAFPIYKEGDLILYKLVEI